ncbi:MAG: malate synthase A [Microbacterium sp.]
MTLIDPTPPPTFERTLPAIQVAGPMNDRYGEILTPEALAFLAQLHELFAGSRYDRLADRLRRGYEIGIGHDPKFREDTAHIRNDPSWRVAGARPGLEDRRVEITGPTDVDSTIAALNSGASVWLADHEDAMSPTWTNVIGGQIALRDAIRGALDVTAESTPTIVMRPRGWHLEEAHLQFTDIHGRTMAASGSLVDFGLYFFHNAAELIAQGAGPYFYIAKLESAEEARLWDQVFTFSEQYLGLDHGTIRATVFIETLPAAFQMDEILYELRDHASGLNAGRWDYIFSIIKIYRGRGSRFVLPDRNEVTMTVGFMRAYTELLLQTAHRRGAHAIGGMSAFIPDPDPAQQNEDALAKVSADKRDEANDGFDGTWVAHPGLVPVAMAEFDAVLGDRPNQLDHPGPETKIRERHLMDLHIGRAITDQGVHENVSVGIRYLEAWLRGQGAVAIDGLMEDTSIAEISRSQIWQWIRQERSTQEGTEITRAHIEDLIDRVLGEVERTDGDRFDDAADVFRDVALSQTFRAFLTTKAYADHLVTLA